jgi:hypothetical protein
MWDVNDTIAVSVVVLVLMVGGVVWRLLRTMDRQMDLLNRLASTLVSERVVDRSPGLALQILKETYKDMEKPDPEKPVKAVETPTTGVKVRTGR